MSRRLFLILGGLVLVAGAILLVYRTERKASPRHATAQITNPVPVGITEDGKGNIYVALRSANLVLKISGDKEVSVAAGNGASGFSGDGGAADEASLSSPTGVGLDNSGNLLIADTGNNRIRRVDVQNKTITTLAGKGSAWAPGGLYEPISVTVDGNDNLYIGGSSGGPIRKIDAITHEMTRVIGAALPGDPFASSPATGPFWVTASKDGTVFFSDPSRNTVDELNARGNSVDVIAGSAVCGFAGDGGPADGALLCFPESVSVDGHRRLFVADTANNRIRRIDLDSATITTVAGNGEPGYSGDGGPAVNAALHGPMGIAATSSGDLFVADTGNHCIRRVDGKTGDITTWVTASDLASPASR